MRAFVLCKFVPGLESKAVSGIRSTPGVTEVNLTFGHWDAIIIAEAETLDKIASIVVRNVRGVQGVADTETLVTTLF